VNQEVGRVERGGRGGTVSKRPAWHSKEGSHKPAGEGGEEAGSRTSENLFAGGGEPGEERNLL